MSEPYILNQGVEDFSKQYDLEKPLARAIFEGLRKSGSRVKLIDLTQDRREYSGNLLLALSIEFAQYLKQEISAKRVGIVLPPGAGGFIANIACLFAGKTPVNLNFTLSKEAANACLENAQIDTLISASAMREKAPHFPWLEHVLDVSNLLPNIPKGKIVRRLLALKMLPTGAHMNLLNLPREGGDTEATVLFTSGSVGEPKGVVLSQRNVLGNVCQIADYDVLHQDDRILACLPIFHSFGFTVTLCFGMAEGISVVTLPSPLDAAGVIRAIEQEQVSVHIATPTLFRPLLKKAKAEQLTSLRAVVAGAEKTPTGFHDKWENTFGSLYLEGYGLTETTPVVACNIPPDGIRRGSVGRLFPGMEACVKHPDNGAILPLGERGLLALKGVNVFKGYLNNEAATQDCFEDGWFITGDLARLDEDGYVSIEGRLSRFSKIGGEMVPHGTVEYAIAKALGKEDTALPALAVSSRPDEAKGEALVLFTTFDLDTHKLREVMGDTLPNLWLPREIKQIEAIPVLGTGKLDLKKLSELAAR